MQQTNPMQYYFEVIEHNEFKRLVHLSLKTGPATDADIKKHMADTILNLKVISNVLLRLIIIMIKILVYRRVTDNECNNSIHTAIYIFVLT